MTKKKDIEFTKQTIFDKYQITLTEISELGVAVLIASFVVLYITGQLDFVIQNGRLSDDFFLFFFVFGISFTCHELMHKFTAQTFGAKAFFQLDKRGMMFTLFSLIIGIPIISPGAVFWFGENSASIGIRGRVSAAGPITNLILVGIFTILQAFSFSIDSSILYQTCSVAIWLNLWLGIFNLLPIGPLDGAKVYYWNVKIWLSLIGTFGLLFLFLQDGFWFKI